MFKNSVNILRRGRVGGGGGVPPSDISRTVRRLRQMGRLRPHLIQPNPPRDHCRRKAFQSLDYPHLSGLHAPHLGVSLPIVFGPCPVKGSQGFGDVLSENQCIHKMHFSKTSAQRTHCFSKISASEMQFSNNNATQTRCFFKISS